jgi:hypothetical protein
LEISVKNPKLCSLASEKESEENDNDRGDRNDEVFGVDVTVNHHILTDQIKHVIRTSSDSDMIVLMETILFPSLFGAPPCISTIQYNTT